DELLYHKILTRESARAVEAAMHSALETYRSAGEWFRFVMEDADHKRDFNAALRIATERHPGSGWKWNRVRVKDVRAALCPKPQVETAAEERRKMRQIHRLVHGSQY